MSVKEFIFNLQLAFSLFNSLKEFKTKKGGYTMIKTNPFNPTFGDIPELFLQAENNPQDVANLIRESKF